MKNGWLWRALDTLAHFLYVPLALGRRRGRETWRHRVHLIPSALLHWVCDRYDAALGGDWMEHEPAEEVMRRFESLPKAVTVAPVGYRCEHVSMTAGGGTLTSVTPWCGCTMQAVYQ